MDYKLVLPVIFLYTLFSLMVFLFAYNWKNFYGFFKKSSKNVVFWSISIFCLALLLRLYLIPHIYHVYYDEFYFVNVAENIYHHNIFGATLWGDKLNLRLLMYPIRLGGYPFLLNLAFKIFGNSPEVAFQVNVFLGALSVVPIFWIGYLLFDKRVEIGIWSALILTFLPSHLKYSGGCGYDISSLLFVLIGIWLILLYLRVRKRALLYLLCTVVIFSAYIRPENIILYFFLIGFIIAEYKKGYLRKKDLALIALSTIVLLSFFISKISYIISLEKANTEGFFVSVKHLLNNFFPNLLYLFDFRYFSLASTIFFFIGTLFLFSKKRKVWILLVGIFLIPFCLYTAHFEGRFSLQFTATSDRHFFPIAISFSILAGYGIYSFLKRIGFGKVIFSFLILVGLVINSFFATKNIIDSTFNRDSYKDYRFVSEAAEKLPKNVPILCMEPFHIITAIDREVIRTDYLVETEDYAKKLILFKGFWWFEPVKKKYVDEFENNLKNLYNFDTIVEKQISEDKKYGFYLLTRK